jgi:hypothetical protein
MDAWMHRPGGRVLGHRAVVRGQAGSPRVLCECGYASAELPSVWLACEGLVVHLQEEVRAGALVVFGDGRDGTAGVREPRRPRPSSGSGAAALDLPAV